MIIGSPWPITTVGPHVTQLFRGRRRFQEMLRAFDTNKDGVISRSEWAQGVRGFGVARQDVDSMFTAIDADGSGAKVPPARHTCARTPFKRWRASHSWHRGAAGRRDRVW